MLSKHDNLDTAGILSSISFLKLYIIQIFICKDRFINLGHQ